jgi:predicted transcriptional regulator
MKVKEIMTKEVISVSCDAKISEVSQILTKHGIHGAEEHEGSEQLLFVMPYSEVYSWPGSNR